MQLNELSLFTGIGGGLLGTKLLGWRHIGYVEINEYCQRVLEQRIKDGILDDAPIFGDIREFNQTYAKEFKGVADVVTSGFPCQPFSVAGKRAGASDERNMWPATIESIRIVRPRYALLENVPGLLTSGYFGTILRDLAESGYDIRWRCLSAAEVGANHRRNRLWILADSANSRTQGMRKRENETTKDVADTADTRLERQESESKLSEGQSGLPAECSWWLSDPAERPAKSRVGRLAHGISGRVERLKAIGNAQVPAMVQAVWELLNDPE